MSAAKLGGKALTGPQVLAQVLQTQIGVAAAIAVVSFELTKGPTCANYKTVNASAQGGGGFRCISNTQP